MFKERQYSICECGSHAWSNVTQWAVIIVDAQDQHLLGDYVWSIIQEDRLSSYVRSPKCMISGVKSGTRLHHAVMYPLGYSGSLDHKNRNGLDCRRDNLRMANQTLNNRNTRSRRNSSSKYLGVSFMPDGRKSPWHGQIQCESKQKIHAFFALESDAAIWYNYHASHLFGDFANLNKINHFTHE